MRLSLFILFIVAFVSQAILIYAYWIIGMTPNDHLDWAALSLTSVCVAAMVAMTIATQNPSMR